ncbi:MAG: hypothetical protein J1E83_00615 [Lachnospiraceae bacterium]|nr:hypothetical protein [Lachnospiraceae bacterium]
MKFKCIYFVFIIYCITLCACSSAKETEYGDQSAEPETVAALPETEPKTEPETEPESFKTAEEFYYRTEKGLVFGELFLALSEDVQVENVGTESNKILLWKDDRRLVPEEMFLSHFTVEWEPKEDFYALIEYLMNLADLKVLRLEGRNEDTGELCLRAYDWAKEYTILVRGQEVYLIEEHSSLEYELDFYDLLSGHKAYWTDTAEKPLCNISAPYPYCMKIEGSDGSTYLIEIESGRAFVYRCGYLENPVQVLEDEGIAYGFFSPYPTDINFDGCPDLLLDGCIYLYDAHNQEFVKAELPAEMYYNYNDGQRLQYEVQSYFPEEKIIWSQAHRYIKERWDAEYLWQWEGNTLVLRREIRWEGKEEEVRLFAKDDKEGILFDITLGREEYELDHEVLKPYYERFYQGYLSEEAYYLNHHDTEEAEHIPEELVLCLEQALVQGTERDMLAALENGRIPTDEELRDIAHANQELYRDIRDTFGGHFILADGDNDGIEDLLAVLVVGGSGGFSEFVFYKGLGNGIFLSIDGEVFQREELFSLEWEGRPYICMTTVNYRKADYDGLGILYYKDGILREVTRIRLVPADYTYRFTQYADSASKEWAKALFTPEICEKLYALTEEGENVSGKAEEESGDAYEYVCDLNNDGVSEHYQKFINQSVKTDEEYLDFRCEEAPEISTVIWSIEGGHTPIMMWVEEFSGKNIVNVMYRAGLYDYCIVGYLIEGDAYTQVFCLEANASYKTERKFYRFYAGYEELERYGDGVRF